MHFPTPDDMGPRGMTKGMQFPDDDTPEPVVPHGTPFVYRKGKAVMLLDGELIEVSPGDRAPIVQQAPPELDWRVVLQESVVESRNGEPIHIGRETTHERIRLLETERQRLDAALPRLKDELLEATHIVEADAARLAALWSDVHAVVAEGQRLGTHVRDFAAQPMITLGRRRDIDPNAYLVHRQCTLRDTREWHAQADLSHRMYDDRRAAEFQAIQRKSDLQDQVTAIPKWIGLIDTKLYELNENLRWHDQQDERSDPNSAWSVAHRQLIERMEADLRARKIIGYQILP